MDGVRTGRVMKKRYLHDLVLDDLDRKMVFIGGPRQVGKTTMASMIAKGFKRSAYLNWDSRPHRRGILDGRWSPDAEIVVFDELHKYARWKSLVKGFCDTRPQGQKMIVTGSSRLDVYRRGGDSLMGRYHYYRLHPFSLAELENAPVPMDFPKGPPVLDFDITGSGLSELLRFGGFPEPLLSGRERVLKRWQRQRFERVFREDIRDTENIRSLSLVELLGGMLPRRVGAPLSMSSLATDLEVSPKTVALWIDLLCRNYYIFKVPPFHGRLHRALKKAAKYYLWDWSEVPGEGERFENLVAAHLLKSCHLYQDAFGIEMNLFYLRDQQKREVDFLVAWEGEPWCIIECKLIPGKGLTNLNYFAERLGVAQRFQVVRRCGVDHLDRRTGVRTLSADRFLMAWV